MSSNKIFLAALALSTAVSLPAQNSIRMDGGPSWQGMAILFTPKVEPGPPALAEDLGGTVIDLLGGVVGQRFIDDPVHKRSIGYDVRLQPAADGHSARISIEPLHAVQHAVKSGWTQFGIPAGLPKYPAIDLHVGDTVAIDLMVNPATGQKLVDYLTLQRPSGAPQGRDLSLADVHLTLDHPRVSVNGQSLAVSRAQAAVSASRFWIYIPGHGRFTLSLEAAAELVLNGTATGKTLAFTDSGFDVRIDCATPIVPADGTFNLYTAHDPAWQPRVPSNSVEAGTFP